MGVLSKGKTFTGTESITTTKVHNLVDDATFTSSAVDSSSTALSAGAIIVKNGGITTAKLATDAVTPAKIDRDGGEFLLDDVTATTAKLTPYADTVSGGVWAPDLDNGNFQIVTIDTTDVTTISALANMESGKQFTFIIVNDGGVTIDSGATWAATWKFQGGDQPAGTAADGSIDIISGVTDGTNAYITMIKNMS